MILVENSCQPFTVNRLFGYQQPFPPAQVCIKPRSNLQLTAIFDNTSSLANGWHETLFEVYYYRCNNNQTQDLLQLQLQACCPVHTSAHGEMHVTCAAHVCVAAHLVARTP
jgi:hypothetical protein